jgi:hypothetical protein
LYSTAKVLTRFVKSFNQDNFAAYGVRRVAAAWARDPSAQTGK